MAKPLLFETSELGFQRRQEGLTEHDPEAGMRKAAAGRRSGPTEAEGRESGSSDAEGAPPLQAPGTHDPRRPPWLIQQPPQRSLPFIYIVDTKSSIVLVRQTL